MTKRKRIFGLAGKVRMSPDFDAPEDWIDLTPIFQGDRVGYDVPVTLHQADADHALMQRLLRGLAATLELAGTVQSTLRRGKPWREAAQCVARAVKVLEEGLKE